MYFPRLDTIRCYAVMAVVFSHIFQIWTWQPETVSMFPMGYAGVVVFFTLSGFLITGLLVKEPPGKPLSQCFLQFYARRSLRIFPIYYLYLIVIYAINLEDIHDATLYPWLYLANIHIFNQGAWIGVSSHIWSLSVEEQFYLVWPFLTLFFRRSPRALLVIYTAVIATSLLSRYFLLDTGYSWSPQIEVFTLTCLDYLAIGGVLALAHIRYGERLKKLGLPLIIASVAAYYGTYYINTTWELQWVFRVFGQMAVATAAAGLIIYALHKPHRNGIFHNVATTYLGKVSYGIYLYHNAIIAYHIPIADFFGFTVGGTVYEKIFWSLLFILAVVSFSYHAIERPVLDLKKRFR